MAAILAWITGLPLAGNSIISMLGTAALVNVVNDLPASAIIGQAVSSFEPREGLAYTVFLQSVLASLNIGCYITPIGALAGIIWFHIMRREAEGLNIQLPTRMGMVVYGLIHFLATALILSVLIPTTNIIFHWATAQGGQSFADVPSREIAITVIAGISVLVITILLSTNILKSQKVLVGDMRAFLTATSWLHVRSRSSGLLFHTFIVLAIVTLFGSVIWWAEENFADENKLDSIGNFLIWLALVLGSGEFQDNFPKTPVAKVVAGLVPLTAIFLIVFVIQITRRTVPLEETSRRIARGEIVTRRSVIVDYEAWMRDFVEQIWKDRNNAIFQTVLYQEQLPPAEWTEERDYAAIYAKEVSLDNSENLRTAVREYQLDRADEVYLLSKRFRDTHQAALVINEIALNLQRNPTEELGERRFAAIAKGEDPEKEAGRLPRIFIWDDVEISLADIEYWEMERLLIKLPCKWRDEPRDKILAPIVNTATEKSWQQRRYEILSS